MLIRFQKLALASLTAAFLSGPAWAGCSDAALALVVDDTVGFLAIHHIAAAARRKVSHVTRPLA